ncbi:hypothetical protein IQ265_01670 [Nodosilinea sp. LEGE 06152]|uniref:hypothetical protein n=1 Tax=Nodosilinea sp. LEGE 06152 TaxID=2777966 RepID=UPI001882EA39|nr:hypothetical protein [Nodosilinea sp. LEGE 06152]MBE9155550.1 hypothetical protein [Nodosilinea sp. LEGE 06152]
MRRPHRHNQLLGITFTLIKYFLLGLAGCTIAYLAALVLDLPLVAGAIAFFLEQVLARSLALLGCLWAIAVINESARS